MPYSAPVDVLTLIVAPRMMFHHTAGFHDLVESAREGRVVAADELGRLLGRYILDRRDDLGRAR
jgi:hypothetical protein